VAAEGVAAASEAVDAAVSDAPEDAALELELDEPP
jgi:hypothetical protein